MAAWRFLLHLSWLPWAREWLQMSRIEFVFCRHGESLPGHALAVGYGYRESSLARFFDQARTSSTTLLLNMLR